MKTFKTNVSFLSLFLILTISTNTFAQEEEAKEEPTFSFSGSIDTYFHTTFNTRNIYYGDMNASSTSFADGKGFALGMANFIASYSGEKVGFVGDIVLGPRGRGAIFGTGDGDTGQGIINQLYAYYNFNEKLKFNLGQFNTYLGYEVISPTINFHYSTSYLFSWGPFNHTGARLDFDSGNGFGAKLGVMNPTDILEFNPINTYTLGAQLSYSGDAGGVYLNFLLGDQDGKLDEDESRAPSGYLESERTHPCRGACHRSGSRSRHGCNRPGGGRDHCV
jgi:hypothetical protein